MRMWVSTSTTLTAVFFLFEIADICAHSDDAMEIMFSERSRSDWEQIWHKETHSRCREKLIRHLYWACEKDIYLIPKRTTSSKIIKDNNGEIDVKHSFYEGPWITHILAQTMLRFRRNGKRRSSSGGSITSECCSRTGCTWEEYAEYCPSNKRLNRYK